jgi:hypothetical protein
MTLVKLELNDKGIQGFLSDEETREYLYPAGRDIFAAIPPSDGIPEAKPKRGEKVVNGRYKNRYQDKRATAQDGRVAVDVGVKDADRSFFRRNTLQKAMVAVGARLKRKKGK